MAAGATTSSATPRGWRGAFSPSPRSSSEATQSRHCWARRAAAALLLVPQSSSAQQAPGKIPRVGILTPADSDRTPIFDAFRAGLRDLGYVEGRNIILEFRLARGDSSLLSRLAAELVGMPVDVIVTDDDPALTGARDATRDIPIVIGATAIDPVLSGLVPSLSHPGGNITGFTLMMQELNA